MANVHFATLESAAPDLHKEVIAMQGAAAALVAAIEKGYFASDRLDLMKNFISEVKNALIQGAK